MLGAPLTNTQAASGNTAQWGNQPVNIAPPTKQLIVLFVVFIMFGLLMAGIFVAYVLPEAAKREAEQHVVNVPTSQTTTQQTPIITPTTTPNTTIETATRSASPSPYSYYALAKP